MILVIAAGLWALIRGQITIMPKLKLVGRQARIFGGALIIIAFTLLGPIANLVLFLLAFAQPSEMVMRIANYATTFLIILGTAYLCTFIKLPSEDKSTTHKAS